MELHEKKRIPDVLVFAVVLFLALVLPAAQGKEGWLADLIQKTDEIITVAAILLLMIQCLRGFWISRLEFAIAVAFLVFLLLGLLSTARAQLQPWRCGMEDLLSCCKFIVPCLAIRSIRSFLQEERILQWLKLAAVWMVRILFVLAAVDLLYPGGIFPRGDYRFFLRAVQLFYFHPAVLAQQGILFLALLSLPGEGRYRKEIWMAVFLVCVTLRMRAVGFLFLYLCIRMMAVVGRRGRYVMGMGGLVGMACIGYESFARYYLQAGKTARSLLTIGGNAVARHFWPLGSGYGTYGSAAAAKYYSPIYTALGYPRRYGLSPRNPQYLSDTFWPAVTAQFGFLGLVLFAGILLLFVWDIYGLYRIRREYVLPAAALYGYLLVSTVGSSSFFNPGAVVYSLVFGLILSAGYKGRKAETQ